MNELETFTQFLYGDKAGFVYAPIKKSDNSWHMHWFSWPHQKEGLHDWVRTQTIDSDVYLSPVLFREKTLNKTSVISSSVVWIEVDGKADFKLKGIPEPSYSIQSSTPYNQHLYWKLQEEVSNEAIEEVNRRLTYYLEADSSGWDITQVLRPPETINHKPGKNVPVQTLNSNSSSFTISSFDKAPSVPTFVPINLESIPDSTPILAKLPLDLRLLVERKVPLNQDRSTFLMAAGYKLAEYGLSHDEIVSLIFVMDGRIRKFIGRHDALDRISQLASIAILKHQSLLQKRTGTFYSPLEVLRSERKLEWYLEGVLPKQGFMFLTGPPSVGKTAFANDLIYSLTTGEPFLTSTPTGQFPVVYFCIEMFFEEQKHFWEMQTKGWNNLELWDKNLQVAFDKDVNEEKIRWAIEKWEPPIVVIDSLSEILLDSKEEEARRITKFVQKMQEEHGTSFIFIHHNRKADSATNAKKPRSLSDLYGSYILAKSCQTVLSLWQDTGQKFMELDYLKGRFLKDKRSLLIRRDENLKHTLFELEVKVDVSLKPGDASVFLKPDLSFGDASNP